MPISVRCPGCGGKFRAKDELAEKVVPCPNCKKPLKIHGSHVSPFDVFLSHSSKDAEEAKAVCHALEQHGIRCWIAPRDIPPGKRWADSIVSAIGNCHILVLLMSDQSVLSEQVLNEIEQAAKRCLPILPIRLNEVQPTSELSYFISRSHWLDAFPEPIEPHLTRIVRDVRVLLSGAEATPRPAEVSPPVSEKAGGRWKFRLVAFALLAVTVTGLWFAAPAIRERLTTADPTKLAATTKGNSSPNPRSDEPLTVDLNRGGDENDPGGKAAARERIGDGRVSPSAPEPANPVPPKATPSEADVVKEGTSEAEDSIPETLRYHDGPSAPPSQSAAPSASPSVRPPVLPEAEQGFQRQVFAFADLTDGSVPDGWSGQSDVFVRGGRLTVSPNQKKEQSILCPNLQLSGDFTLRLSYLINSGGELSLALQSPSGKDRSLRLYHARVEMDDQKSKTVGMGGKQRDVVLSRRGQTVSLRVDGAEQLIARDLASTNYTSLRLGFVTGGITSGIVEAYQLIIDREDRPAPLVSEPGKIDFEQMLGETSRLPNSWDGKLSIQARTGPAVALPGLYVTTSNPSEDQVLTTDAIKLGGKFFIESQLDFRSAGAAMKIRLESTVQRGPPLEYELRAVQYGGWQVFTQDSTGYPLTEYNQGYFHNVPVWIRLEQREDEVVVFADGKKSYATIAKASEAQYDRLIITFPKQTKDYLSLHNLRWGPLENSEPGPTLAFGSTQRRRAKLGAQDLPSGWVRLAGDNTATPQRVLASNLQIGANAEIDFAFEMGGPALFMCNLIGKDAGTTLPIHFSLPKHGTHPRVFYILMGGAIEEISPFPKGTCTVKIRRSEGKIQVFCGTATLAIEDVGFGEFGAIECDLINGAEGFGLLSMPTVSKSISSN